jgi:nucleotide-binding universal stress UspA family protein
MPHFQSILCPVDFSPHASRALRVAAALAAREGATLTVVWVQDRLLAQAATVYALDPKREAARADLQAFVANAVPAGTVPSAIDVVVAVGTAEKDILKIARKRRADLIVMGTHGLSGYQKMFFGSTTERVLRHTTIPVLAVPGREESAPASTEDGQLRGPVVIAVDLGQSSQMLVDTGGAIATALESPMVVVHVVEPRNVPAPWHSAMAAYQATAVADAQRALDGLHPETSGIQVECVVATGRPADQIAALAEHRDAALIVMGIIGGQGRIGARPGSIAYRVLTLAPAPVLVIPASATPLIG